MEVIADVDTVEEGWGLLVGGERRWAKLEWAFESSEEEIQWW